MLVRKPTRDLVRNLTRDLTVGFWQDTYDVYGDSVNGSDVNDGLTESSPLQTLSAIQTAAEAVGSGARIRLLNQDSHWRGTLNIETLDNCVVVGDGGTIDGADIVTSWSLASGQSNTYEASIAHNADGTHRLTAYEDGVLLDRVDDVAACEAAAGSFVDVQGSDGTPVTMHIHPSDSGNPTTNGKVYEVSTRRFALVFGNNTRVESVKTQRAIVNNGSFDGVNELDVNASKILASWGTKHNIGIGSGVVSDSIAYAADPPTSYEPSNTMLVAYLDDIPFGTHYTFERVGAIQLTGINGGSAMGVAHSSNASLYASGTMRQCWAAGDVFFQNLGGVAPWENLFMTGCHDELTIRLGVTSGTVKYATANDSYVAGTVNNISTADIEHASINIGARATNGNNSSVFKLTGGANADVTIGRCAFYMEAIHNAGNWYNNSNATGGAFDINYSIVFGGIIQLQIPSGVVYSGNYNVFFAKHDPLDEPFHAQYAGTFYTTLAGWQSATSQDTDSVYAEVADQAVGNSNAFWLGWANGGGDTITTVGPAVGDFRINPSARVYGGDGTAYIGTFADGTTPITAAGPQSHWHWNARTTASGPPTAWPDVPESLSEAETYVANPGGWDFYP